MAEPTSSNRTWTGPGRRALGTAAGLLPGVLLGAAFGAAAWVRRTKPLHPRGQVGGGVIDVASPLPELGVPLLAAAGSHACTVRWSRSVGLPKPMPDVEGLAIRIHDPVADLLFAATGTGPLGRFLLLPRRAGSHGAQTTLLPVATDAGALLLKVEPADEAEPPMLYDLAVSRGRAPWRSVGSLRVHQWGPDQVTRFDPVVNQVPGTRQYPFVRVLREPAYVMARRGTDARGG